VGKKLLDNIHFLLYGIFFLGNLIVFNFPVLTMVPMVSWFLYICVFLGLILHIRKVRKEVKPTIGKEKRMAMTIVAIICFVVGVAMVILILIQLS